MADLRGPREEDFDREAGRNWPVPMTTPASEPSEADALADRIFRQMIAGGCNCSSACLPRARRLLADLRRSEREAALAPFRALFGLHPDTSCRTTWPDGVECVEVPMADLRDAFDRARKIAARHERIGVFDV